MICCEELVFLQGVLFDGLFQASQIPALEAPFSSEPLAPGLQIGAVRKQTGRNKDL